VSHSKDAAAQWDRGFVGHSESSNSAFVQRTISSAQVTAFFFRSSTTWRGIYKDRRFEKHGPWSFVLKNTAGERRILACGWGQKKTQHVTPLEVLGRVDSSVLWMEQGFGHH
jgi:hypothetical protein